MRPIDANALVVYLYKETEECIAMEDHVPEQFKEYYRGKMEAFIEVAAHVKRHTPTIDYAPNQQWISVKNRLPEFRDWALVIGKFVPEGYWIVPHIAEFRNGVWHSDDIDCAPLEELALTVTHWMPLPEPPKEEA